MSDLGTGLPLVPLIEEVVARGPHEVLPRLGAYALVGELDEDEPRGWAFSTTMMVAPSVSAAIRAGLEIERGIVYPLVKRTTTFPSVILVGRSSSNDVQVVHHSISKLHARIRLHENGFDLEDAGSLNGTFAGAGRIDGPVTLGNGDRLGLGTLDFTVHASARLVDVLLRIGPL